METVFFNQIKELLSLGVSDEHSSFESRQIRTLNSVSLFLGLITLLLLFFNLITKSYQPLFFNIAVLSFICLPIFFLNYFSKYKIAQVYSFFASNTLVLLFAYFGISKNQITNFEVLLLGCGFFGAFIFNSTWALVALFYNIISFLILGLMKVYIANMEPNLLFMSNIINSGATALFLFGMIHLYKKDVRRSELALQKSEDRLSLVIKGSNNGWWDWDLLANNLYYSPRWWTMLGLEPNENFTDTTLWEKLLHPEDVSHVNNIFGSALKNGIASYEVEFRLLHRAGHYVPILSKGYILRDTHGKPIRVSGTNIDLTEHKKIEAKLQSLVDNITEKNEELSKQKSEIQNQSEKLAKLNQLKDKLFSIIAHDMRSPLTSLLLTLNSLRDEVFTIQDLKETLPDIIGNAKNILALIDSLLDWAKAQLNGTNILCINFDIKELVDEELKLLSFRAKEKNVQIINHLNSSYIVHADRNLMQLVFRNLVTNSLKFSNSQGKIIISAKTISELLELSVTDTGKGISASDLKHIFTPSMASKMGTSGEKGTGLGLILSKEFVTKNGGEIGVESELTKGSRFYFTIPLAK